VLCVWLHPLQSPLFHNRANATKALICYIIRTYLHT
jgi:hypothetical protein